MRRMLKLLTLILVITSLFALGACAEQTADDQETQGQVDVPFDPENPYLLMGVDIQHGSIIVMNLDAEDPMDPNNYYWEWTPEASLGWKYPNKLGSLCGAKLRWSEIHQSYVVLMTSASGWVGIAEYPSGKCLWETIDTGNGPHSVEMLPNGDLVVACSGSTRWETEGCMLYYDTSDGINYTITSKEMLPSAHGALWDPEYNVLWAIGYYELVAYDIAVDDNGKPVLSKRTDNMGAFLVSPGGHDLMPDYSDPNLIWITCNKTVQKYDKNEDKVWNIYTYSDQLANRYRVKGITSFADGTVVYSKYNDSDEYQDTFYVLWPLDLEGKEAALVEYQSKDDACWYKVRNFDPDYQ